VSESPDNSPARERLTQVAATTDGFELAQADLQLRKEGDILGASQSGRRSQLRLLEVIKDADLVAEAREAAIEWVDFDPALKAWPALQTAVAEINQERPTEFLERN
jgi:ATP-dependent DNA helicase RecG